jgi:hypothetical protein
MTADIPSFARYESRTRSGSITTHSSFGSACGRVTALAAVSVEEKVLRPSGPYPEERPPPTTPTAPRRPMHPTQAMQS